jgi:hypothetical protein
MESKAEHLMSARLAATVLAFFVVNAVTRTGCAKPVCFPQSIPDAPKYENYNYQFSIVVPGDLHACMNSSPCPNHGIWMPLKGDPGCEDFPHVPYIAVDAEYNTAEEADTAQGLAAIQCYERGARHTAWLRGEHFGGREAVGCRRDFPDDHVEVSITILRKTGAWAAQWIQVNADLATTPSRYEDDMRIFRRVLKRVWIHPDGPED